MNDAAINPAPADSGVAPVNASGSQRFKQIAIFALKFSIAVGALYYVIQTKVIPNHKGEKEIIAISEGIVTLRDAAGKEQDIIPGPGTKVIISGKSSTIASLAIGQRVRVEMDHEKVVRIEDPKAGIDKLMAMLTNPAVLLAAIAAFSMQLCIGAQRLRMLLRPQGVNISYLTSIRLTYVGAFFDTFMITSVGGDAIKAIYLAREAPRNRRVEAVSVLVLDRLMGLIGLLFLALAVSSLEFRNLAANPETAWMIKFLIIVPCLLLVGTAMLLSETVYMSAPMQLALRHLPMGAVLSRAYGSLQKFRDRPGVLVRAFLLSLVVHCFGVLTGYIFVLMGYFDAEPGRFSVALLICNFACSFAPFAGIGIGQAVYDPLFEKVARMTFGWVLATVMQAAILLAKAPGFVAWLLSRETVGADHDGSRGPDGKSAAITEELQPQLDSAPK
jgi:hypothetical protein